MKINEYIGKVVQVKIISKKDNWYISKILNNEITVYIEDTKDYEEEELIGKTEKCIILKEKQGKLIGFLLTNRKFINDIKRIEKILIKKDEYRKVKDIYLVKRLKVKDKIVGLYLVDEEDIGKYYLDTTEIGTYVKKIRNNNIIIKEKKIEEELVKQIKDIVQSIDLTKKEISLRQEQEKEKNIIEKALGIEKEREIIKIATIDLKQKVKQIQEENNVKLRKESIQKAKSEDKKENTIKDINIKQELETKDKVTDMKTLGKILKDNNKLPDIKGKEFIKLGIVESNEKRKLKNNELTQTNTTRYSFVAIAKDGSVVPLDLEQDHTEGNNPRETNYQITQKGEVKQDDVLSRYKIGEGTFAIKNGEYGEIKVYHSPRKTIGGKGIEGNKSLDRELETNNVWELKKEERDLASEIKSGYRSTEESYKEAKLHEDSKGKIIDENKMKTKDIDGDINTKTHIHDNIDYNKLAIKWGYYKEGKPYSDKAKELFEEKRKENPKKEAKEIVEMVTEELEEEIGHNLKR